MVFHAARFLLVGRQSRTKSLLREHLGTVPGEYVLDVCCGVGEFAEVVDGQYLGVDLNPRFIQQARQTIPGAAHEGFQR